MKRIRKIFLGLILLTAVADVMAAGIVVVVNRANTLEGMTRHQLVDMYMGRDLIFPDGSPTLPLDQSPDSDIRVSFYRHLLNKSVAQVNAYWARLLFTGRASPPRPLSDSTAVLRTVRDNRDAIGYLKADQVDDTVKVVYRFE